MSAMTVHTTDRVPCKHWNACNTLYSSVCGPSPNHASSHRIFAHRTGYALGVASQETVATGKRLEKYSSDTSGTALYTRCDVFTLCRTIRLEMLLRMVTYI